MSSDAETARQFLRSLLVTERLPTAELQQYQENILEQMLQHALQHVPFYKTRLAPLLSKSGNIDLSRWHEIPILDKATVESNWEAMQALSVPDNHGEVKTVSTGGSTGKNLVLKVSELENMARVTASFRMFQWFDFDCSKKLAMIRKPQVFKGIAGSTIEKKWGYPWLDDDQLGDRLRLDISMPPQQQMQWLVENRPTYINTFPSNILALSLETKNQEWAIPKPRAFISVSELLTDDVRDSCKTHFGVEIVDVLSSAEAGFMAVQCPHSGKYHIQSELVRVEVLDKDDKPCEPGQTGEIVVTPLYNFAMPFIRYRMGDYVIQGEPCGCGRSLPTIDRIIGRQQHLFKYADGTRSIPSVNREEISRLLRTRFWKFVQTDDDHAELVYAEHGADTDTDAALAILENAVPQAMRICSRLDNGIRDGSHIKWHYVLSELP